MKKIFSFLALSTVLISLSSCTIFKSSDDDNQKNVNEDAEVVEISSSYKEVYDSLYNSCFGVKASYSSGYMLGSCVCIKQDDKYSYFITNRHVIEDGNDKTKESSSISIYCGNGYYISASLVANTTYSERTANSADDLAILKCSTPSNRNMTPVELETANITRGISVVSIGCPISLSYYNTITTGIIEKEVLAEDLYIHTATINSGNSGGGLFDLAGKLVGLNVSKLESKDNTDNIENINYAITINHINSFLKKKNFTI